MSSHYGNHELVEIDGVTKRTIIDAKVLKDRQRTWSEAMFE